MVMEREKEGEREKEREKKTEKEKPVYAALKCANHFYRAAESSVAARNKRSVGGLEKILTTSTTLWGKT